MSRPAKRRETAADLMSRQQKELDERAGPVTDVVQQAMTHNETHPKLKRQLAKRRSLTEFMDRPVKRARLCQAALGNRGSRYDRRRPARRQPERRRPQPNRVAKRRERRICSCSECLKKPVCRKAIATIRVFVTNKRIGTDTSPVENVAAILRPKSMPESNHSILHTPVFNIIPRPP